MNDTTFTTGYPILGGFLTILFIFAWFVYIWVAISIISDIFRRTDLSGWGKAGWILGVAVFSWFGVLIYMIVNHQGMQERQLQQASRAKGELDDYVRSVAGAPGPVTEIAKAKGLLDSGAISQAEYTLLKTKALGAT